MWLGGAVNVAVSWSSLYSLVCRVRWRKTLLTLAGVCLQGREPGKRLLGLLRSSLLSSVDFLYTERKREHIAPKDEYTKCSAITLQVSLPNISTSGGDGASEPSISSTPSLIDSASHEEVSERHTLQPSCRRTEMRTLKITSGRRC